MNSLKPENLPIFVVDDKKEMRESIEWTLASVGYKVNSFERAQDCIKVLDPDVPLCAIVDLLMPGMTGLQFCRELFKVNCNCSVIMISAHGDVASAVEAIKTGVSDFLEKPFSRESLLNAVRRGGERAIAISLEHEEESQAAGRFRLLSPRERQVLECMSQGMVTKQIASRLEISSRTVDAFRASISQKLEMNSTSQLARLLLLNHRHESRTNTTCYHSNTDRKDP